jgi:hypothetical protein
MLPCWRELLQAYWLVVGFLLSPRSDTHPSVHPAVIIPPPCFLTSVITSQGRASVLHDAHRSFVGPIPAVPLCGPGRGCYGYVRLLHQMRPTWRSAFHAATNFILLPSINIRHRCPFRSLIIAYFPLSHIPLLSPLQIFRPVSCPWIQSISFHVRLHNTVFILWRHACACLPPHMNPFVHHPCNPVTIIALVLCFPIFDNL